MRKYISSLFTSLLLVASLFAYQPAMADDSQLSADLDVPSFLIMDWYTSPDKEPFSKGLFSGWSLVPFWNPYYTLNPSNVGHRIPNVSFGVGLQKEFNKSNALRLSATYQRGDYFGADTTLFHRTNRLVFSADYLWNLSNHWFGYDPARSWEWLLMAGGSWGFVDNRSGAHRNFWMGQLGFQVRKTLSPSLSAFVEPYYYVADTEYDMYHNGVDIDDGVGVKAGLIFRLSKPWRQTPWFGDYSHPSWAENWFAQTNLGLNFHNISGLKNVGVTLSNYNFNVNVGRWVAPSWGFQVGFVDRQLLGLINQDSDKKVGDYRQSFLRFEGLLNFPAFWDKVSIGRLGVNVSGGLEVGSNRYKEGETYGRIPEVSEFNLFYGVSGALQLKYFLGNSTALVAEDRYSWFAVDKGVHTPSIGVEFYRSKYARYTPWHKIHNGSKPSFEIPFIQDRNWFFESSIGFIKGASNNPNWHRVASQFELGVGFRLDSLQSIRIKDRLSYHVEEESVFYSYFDNQLGIDYIFDITNLWLGTNPSRRWSLRPFAGAVYSSSNLTNINEYRKEPVKTIHSFGGEFGVQNAFRLNSNVELYFEPRYLALLSDYSRWSLSFGATYAIDRFLQLPKVRDNADPSHLYVQGTGGLQLASGFGFYGVGEGHGNFDLTLGHTFARTMAIQGSLFSQNYTHDLERTDFASGLRVELVGDLLRMVWPESHEYGWAWTGQAGYSFGRAYRQATPFYGPTVATQVRRRLGNTPTWFLLQGRLETFFPEHPKALWSLQAGLHYEFPDAELLIARQKSITGDGSTPSASEDWRFKEVDVNVAGALALYDASTIGYSASVGVDIQRTHGIRAGFTHTATRNRTEAGEHVQLDQLSLDYLYNVVAPLYGRYDAPRLAVKPFLGLNMSFHNYEQGSPVSPELSQLLGQHHIAGTEVYELPDGTTFHGVSSDFTNSETYFGFEGGLHIDYRLFSHLSLFCEQRALYLPFDAYLSPSAHRYWHHTSLAGIQIHF